MNLPTIHEREFIVQKADAEFGYRLCKEVFDNSKATYDDSINSYSQIIINLSKEDSEKIYYSDLHRQIEKILNEVDEEYNLSYGETVSIITGRIQSDCKYIIRYERHGDFEECGGTR